MVREDSSVIANIVEYLTKIISLNVLFSFLVYLATAKNNEKEWCLELLPGIFKKLYF